MAKTPAPTPSEPPPNTAFCQDCPMSKGRQPATMLCLTCPPWPRALCGNCSRAHPNATVKPD